jgi:hypothetical protein
VKFNVVSYGKDPVNNDFSTSQIFGKNGQVSEFLRTREGRGVKQNMVSGPFIYQPHHLFDMINQSGKSRKNGFTMIVF